VEMARTRSDGAEVLDTEGRVRLARGEFPLAIEAFERALASRPHAASTHYRHALALLGAGRREEARAALEQALSQGPFPEAEDARRRLSRLRAAAS